MKFKHVSMVARDVAGLAKFYETVFGCTPSGPPKKMSGELLADRSELGQEQSNRVL